MRLTSLHAAWALAGVLAGGFHATYADAATRNPWAIDWMTSGGTTTPASGPWRVDFLPLEAPDRAAPHALLLPEDAAQDPSAQPSAARPKAFDYSHGYEVRRKIHVYASVAMLPLFATQLWLGDKLYDGGFTEGQRTAHQWVGASIGSLFVLNTVTGVWNLKEGWKDPAHHKLRVAHGLLMLSADAGFAITGLIAPSEDGTGGDRTAHRAMAYTSMAIATTGYLVMLFGKH